MRSPDYWVLIHCRSRCRAGQSCLDGKGAQINRECTGIEVHDSAGISVFWAVSCPEESARWDVSTVSVE